MSDFDTTASAKTCSPANELNAEIIAIGDELIGGISLDTNSQWIAQQLDRLGVHTRFHSTVGDDLQRMQQVFQVAAQRADIIITTGGLGPTADDLTRYAIADLGKVELPLHQETLDHIRAMYQRRGREMPPNNTVQARFPQNGTIIPNPEGTAPGIEFAGQLDTDNGQHAYRFFAFPGVPAELKQMWRGTVEDRIIGQYGIDGTIFHHTIHCFGAGESAIEMQLPDLIERGRDPLVGITASQGTISLRIATRAPTQDACLAKMQPTIQAIHQRLGNLVFGENGLQLEQAAVDILLAQRQTIEVLDWGLNGEVARRLANADPQGQCLVASQVFGQLSGQKFNSIDEQIKQVFAGSVAAEHPSFRLLIGPVDRHEGRVQAGDSYFDVAIGWQNDSRWCLEKRKFHFIGHSAWRDVRAVKNVLNAIRLLK